MKQQQCLTCRFWLDADIYTNQDHGELGMCRRYPPSPPRAPWVYENRTRRHYSSMPDCYPIVPYVYWCGEWQEDKP